jgi:hypothetical protein
MATILDDFGGAQQDPKPMKQYRSVIQLSDATFKKYDSQKILPTVESSEDLKGGKTLVLAVPLGIIVLMAIALGFQGAVSGGAYTILIALSAILIAILVYVAVTLLGDSE